MIVLNPRPNPTRKFVIAVLVLWVFSICWVCAHPQSIRGYWAYNGFMNEFQYRMPSGATCGAVGVGSDGMFYADVVQPHHEALIASKEFYTMALAEAFVQENCEAK